VNSLHIPNARGNARNDDCETIERLFAAQAARTPECVALVFGEQVLTYRQLEERANRQAWALKALGVGPETRVGVFMDRSPDMIAAILAILKAGAAYVPLDPVYPSERIALVIEDSRAHAVLTTEQIRAALPSLAAHVLSVDDPVAGIVNQSADPVPCSTAGDSLAYVIYTSGSTGKPKGVMVEHRNVFSFFAATDSILGTEPGVWLAVTSISFDISVLELLWTLTRGFKVVLHGDEGTHTIASEIIRHGVTHFQSTPSLARMLVNDPRSHGAICSVKKLLLGGEALPPTLVDTLRGGFAGDLYNMYGPTETTVWSTAYRIPQATNLGATVPIGRPLANTHAYILDSQLQLMSDGEPGELFLGGNGVVRGYWERPKLTADRFLPDRFAGHGRMYRTGDVARFLPDGNLEFLGRTDFQLKLRGYRIELGEIEAVLEQLSTVKQAVVVPREDRRGDKRLVAYIVPVAEERPSPAALRGSLALKLPEYMVPSSFLFVDRLPLTPNGKIDRNALPDVDSQKTSAESPPSWGDGPRQQVERVIVKVWAEALGVDRVGLDENIFDLGATSLMMPEVQIELQRILAREIPLVDLFEFHTVSTLAAHLAGDKVQPRNTNRAQRRLAARHQ
jgi:amino acid adenylation domain-containing protein